MVAEPAVMVDPNVGCEGLAAVLDGLGAHISASAPLESAVPCTSLCRSGSSTGWLDDPWCLDVHPVEVVRECQTTAIFDPGRW